MKDFYTLIDTIWTSGDIFFVERVRLQLALGILLYAFTAARAGALVVSNGYENSESPRCLTYRASSASHSGLAISGSFKDALLFVSRKKDGIRARNSTTVSQRQRKPLS